MDVVLYFNKRLFISSIYTTREEEKKLTNDVIEKFACLKKKREKENEGQCHYLGTHIIIARFNGVKKLLLFVLVQS
jgi:hypothetical protein